MKIMLIGKNGQLGKEIYALAKKQRLEIVGFDKREIDITNYPLLKKQIDKVKPQVIINTAAFHHVADCETQQQKAFEVNVFASRYLAEFCNERNIRLVTFSTDKVFDGKKKTAYKEIDIPNPLQMYGLSNYARELVIKNIHPQSIIIRTCGIFGGEKGSRVKGGNFVLYIIKEAKLKKSLEISSEQIASFAYAADLAKATLQLLKKKNAQGIFHLVHEGYASWADFAKTITRYKKLDLKIIPIDRKGSFNSLKIPSFTPLKNTRAKSLGITMPPWRMGLKAYITFLENRGF